MTQDQSASKPSTPPEYGQKNVQEANMQNKPQADMAGYRAAGKLQGRVAIVTGADSGIGRAVAIAFAKEGADVAIVYHDAHEDAQQTKQQVEAQGRKCITIAGDVGDENFCQQAVQQTMNAFGKLNILVNDAGEQHPQPSIEQISAQQLERTFRTNIFAMFFMVKAALKHLDSGSAIINTASVTAFEGSGQLIDYSASKGAIVSFTRALSHSLVEKGIRVNAVAPGPVWTPLIKQTMPPEKVQNFGKDVPMKRPAQPDEIAPSYVFLASDDASYYSGQILNPNGGNPMGS